MKDDNRGVDKMSYPIAVIKDTNGGFYKATKVTIVSYDEQNELLKVKFRHKFLYRKGMREAIIKNVHVNQVVSINAEAACAYAIKNVLVQWYDHTNNVFCQGTYKEYKECQKENS